MAVRDLKPKQIWEALHPEERQVESVVPPISDLDSLGRKKSQQQTKGFAASTAEATGMTKQAINRAIARADALGDEALAKVVPDSPTLDCNTSLVQLCQPRKQIWEALHPEEIAVRQVVALQSDELEVESVVPPQVSTHGGARPQTKADLGGAAS